MITVDDLLSRLEGVKKAAGGYVARCPVHEDRHASLSVNEGDRGLLVKCHANCDPQEVVRRLGLEWSDLFYEDPSTPQIDKTYDYVDEEGQLLYQSVRMVPKDFRARVPDGAGDWVWRLGDVRRVLYRLPEVMAGIEAGRRIYVVEGEKDADAIFAAGGVATCNVGGAGKWRSEYTEMLRGANVRIVADRDPPPRVEGGRTIPGYQGQDHAKAVAAALEGIAASVLLWQAKEGKDASDHFAAGHGLDDFAQLHTKALVNFKSLDLEGPPPDTKWLVEDVAVCGEVTLLVGDGGIGKSFITKALALAVAGGASMFAGRAVFAHGPVVVVDEENSPDLILQRLHKLGLTEHHRSNLHYLCYQGIDLTEGPDRLLEDIKAVGAILVVIDSQSRVLLGVDENSNSEMSAAYRRSIVPLARETGAAVVLIHHTSEGASKPRGATGIRNAADQVLSIRKDKDSDELLIWPSKPRRKTAPIKLTIDDEGTDRICVNPVIEGWRP